MLCLTKIVYGEKRGERKKGKKTIRVVGYGLGLWVRVRVMS